MQSRKRPREDDLGVYTTTLWPSPEAAQPRLPPLIVGEESLRPSIGGDDQRAWSARSSAAATSGRARWVAIGLLGLRVSLWCWLAMAFSSVLVVAALYSDNALTQQMLPVTAPLTLALVGAFSLFAVLGLVACLWIPARTGVWPWIVAALVAVVAAVVTNLFIQAGTIFSFVALLAVLWGMRKLADSQGAYGEVRAADETLRKLVFVALLVLGSVLVLLAFGGTPVVFVWPALVLAALYLTIAAWFECDALFTGLRNDLLRQGLV